jgi:hypothetical protein
MALRGRWWLLSSRQLSMTLPIWLRPANQCYDPEFDTKPDKLLIHIG